MDDVAQDPLHVLPAALRTLAARGVPRRFRKGALLIQEGELRDEQYIVLSGRVQAYSIDERGREIVYGEYGPGEYLGEMSLDGGPRSASVRALEEVQSVMLTRHTLRDHIAANPDFAFELIGRVIRRARMATMTARRLALLDASGRLVALLEELAEPQADGTRVILKCPTHIALSERVGCDRSMVTRLFKELEQRGILRRDGKRVTLLTRASQRW